MPRRIPATAPMSTPIPIEPAAHPMSTPAPTQTARTARSRPPAPAGSNDDGEAACICAARITDAGGSLVTQPTGVTVRKAADFVPLSTMPLVARPRVLLVHGSVVNGDATWAAQKRLAERFDLVVPNRRGFPPGPDVESVDFEDEAAWADGPPPTR